MNGAPRTSAAILHQEVLKVLMTRISPLNARSMLVKALDRAGLPRDAIKKEQVPVLVAALAPGCKLFVGEEATVMLEAISSLGGNAVLRQPVRVAVMVESDIAIARRASQVECVHSHASGFATQRVITIVSELARNIVSYSKGGFIEIAPQPGKLIVLSVDTGPGITNLPEIMSGAYKSKTGLGKGIVGVKRLSTRFDIVTGPKGTRIEAEVSL